MKRNTLNAKILAQSNIDDAIDVAFFGRVLSPIERAALSFNTGKGTAKDELPAMMLDAVAKLDSAALCRVASLLEHLKKKPEHPDAPDMRRVRVLWTLKGLREADKWMPLRDLAGMCGEKDPGDGFSQFRRFVKKFGVPISPDREAVKKTFRPVKSS